MSVETQDRSIEPVISPARYARRMIAVSCPSNDGYKTRAARLAAALARSRYSHREHSYLMSVRNAKLFKKLYADGWDASVITLELEPPREGKEEE